MEMQSNEFITENAYQGGWNEQINCMEGFGRYIFGDGTEYQGYFKNGQMHGCGAWQFEPPNNCSVITTYDNGKLLTIDEIIDSDGLQFQVLEKAPVCKMNWKYCTANDRRFAEEIFRGLQPVGDTPFTKQLKLELKPGQYNTVDAIFMERSGFKVTQSPSIARVNFVGCATEREWIENYCTKGLKPGEYRLPDKVETQKILALNFKQQNDLMKSERDDKNHCVADFKGQCYFERLCKFESRDAEVMSVTSNINTINKCHTPSSTTTTMSTATATTMDMRPTMTPTMSQQSPN